MNKDSLLDVLERAFWTAAQAFLAVFIVTDMSSAKSGGVAAGAAALSVVKGFVGTQVGNKGEASIP